MSARGQPPIGASSRADLFVSSARAGKNETEFVPVIVQAQTNDVLVSSRDKYKDDYGLPETVDDPLQLEHILGYSGNFRKMIFPLKTRENCFVKRLESVLSLNITPSFEFSIIHLLYYQHGKFNLH